MGDTFVVKIKVIPLFNIVLLKSSLEILGKKV